MTAVRWSIAARDDLRDIDAWLEREASPQFAIVTLASIRERASFLARFPRGGRPHADGTRILRVLGTPYLIHYQLGPGRQVDVLRVYHEREDWQIAP
ncbi:MAG: type II toxin-antitoxin system RelE/ParE family toxin [Sphingomonas adhaesiva]|uniref:type II toxin-antitoxin system RelE/ParE family toxin n=1 Tax=Sphingomonas adhaesiva TaxID=28212 RepID=UPI002FF7A9F5